MLYLPDVERIIFSVAFRNFPDFFCSSPRLEGGFRVGRGGLRGVVPLAKMLGPIYHDFSAFFRIFPGESSFRTPNAPLRGGFRLMKVYAHRGSFGSNLPFFH